MNEQGQKVIFSAVKPTGSMTLGNYAGALKNWVAMQEDPSRECYFCVADMHSITVETEAAALRKDTLEDLAMYLALGLDPEKSTLFVQSHVSAHAELAWVLNCCTMFGEARRMTQFKEKSKRNPEFVTVGLFDYPVLMAADILLYQADEVPVGQDQKQHVELARTVAGRFNNRYSPTFVMPEPVMPKHGAKIHSLQNPLAKMSKTDGDPNGSILLLDSPEEITRKCKRAVTDSDSCVKYDRTNKPGVSNLIAIYAVVQNCTVPAAEKTLCDLNYAALKTRVAEAVVSFLQPVQAEFKRIAADKAYLAQVMQTGAEKAARAANKTLRKVYRKVGFVSY